MNFSPTSPTSRRVIAIATPTETRTHDAAGENESIPMESPRKPESAAATVTERGHRAAAHRAEHGDWVPHDVVDEWGVQSFPASDPPANW
jgi:hypothetical protein